LVVVENNEQEGGHVVAGAGELHIEICLGDLERFAGIEIVRSEPVIRYRESVEGDSNVEVNMKTENKHNRLFGVARAISEAVANGIESGGMNIGRGGGGGGDHNTITIKDAHWLWKTHGWTLHEAKKVIYVDGSGNVIVDGSHGVAHLAEAREAMCDALANSKGILCGEPLRGIRFELLDANLHGDAVHRCGRQLGPAARKLLHATQLTARPILLEPIYLVEIQTDQSVLGGVYSVLATRRGTIVSDEVTGGGSTIHTVRGHLPVSESFGLTEALRGATAGRASPQCAFSHWARVPGDPLEEGSFSNKIVMGIRQRKKMIGPIPTFDMLVERSEIKGFKVYKPENEVAPVVVAVVVEKVEQGQRERDQVE